jgi:hypothetical protein
VHLRVQSACCALCSERPDMARPPSGAFSGSQLGIIRGNTSASGRSSPHDCLERVDCLLGVAAAKDEPLPALLPGTGHVGRTARQPPLVGERGGGAAGTRSGAAIRSLPGPVPRSALRRAQPTGCRRRGASAAALSKTPSARACSRSSSAAHLPARAIAAHAPAPCRRQPGAAGWAEGSGTVNGVDGFIPGAGNRPPYLLLQVRWQRPDWRRRVMADPYPHS